MISWSKYLTAMHNDDICKIAIAISFLSLPFTASANIIWPSIYIVQQYYVWYVILIGLIIEIIAARLFLKTNWGRSTLIMFVVNVVSALLGLFLIPISGILVELLTIPFGGGTFDLSHWIIDYLCAVIINTCVELLALKWIFKYPFKPNFWWLFGANLISVIVSLILLLI